MAAYPTPTDPRRGTGGDTLGQMLVTLQQLSEQVSSMRQVMATREDLKELVSKAEYAADQRAAADRTRDHAQRITDTERQVASLIEKLHALEIADVQRNNSLAMVAQAGVAQAQVTAMQQGTQATSAADSKIGKLKDMLLGAFVTAFFSLLIYVATHPR